MNSFFTTLYWHIYIESLIREYWIALFVFSILFACLCSYIANTKHRDGVAWFFIGLILGIFGLIAIMVVPELEIDEKGELLRCSNCNEPITKTSTICSNCGAEINQNSSNKDFSELNLLLENKEEWIAKRIIELISDGKEPSNAQIQANAEYTLEKKAFDDLRKEKQKQAELDKRIQELKKLQSNDTQFSYNKYSEVLENFKSTYEILEYLKSLKIVDEYFNQIIIPKVEKFCYIEKFYGNKVSDTLKYLKNPTEEK